MRVQVGTLAVLVSVLVSCSGPLSKEIKPAGNGIVGGTLVPEGSELASSIVGIYDTEGDFACTGTLIDENTVLTAAHCVYDSNSNKMKIVFSTDMMAVIGTLEPDVQRDLMRDVSSFKYHKDYDPKEQEENPFDWSDIALIKFKGTTPAGYKPAVLLRDKKDLSQGQMVTMAGYGVTTVTTTPVNPKKIRKLKEAIENGEIICDDDNKNCERIIMSGDGELRQTQAPIGHIVRSEIRLDETLGHATCSGDSGGPIFIEKDGQMLVAGVTSRGSLFCNSVGVYTNVPYFQDWIDQTAKELK